MNVSQRETTVSEVVDNHPLSRFQISVILMCAFVAVLDGFDTQSIGFLAPAIAESLNVPLPSFAPVFVAGLLGLMCGAAVLGPRGRSLGPEVDDCHFHLCLRPVFRS